jgi:DNA ligase-1
MVITSEPGIRMSRRHVMPIKKPMLAGTLHAPDLESVEWPVLASPKIDGIRCIVHPELGPVTRSFKPVPNVATREALMEMVGDTPLDGELVVLGSNGQPVDFNTTQSGIMTRAGEPRIAFMVFDWFGDPEMEYERRLQRAIVETRAMPREVFHVVHGLVESPDDFMEFAAYCMQHGFEGAMIRDPKGPYKNGRSTLRQGWLLKYKEWHDAEGLIVGFDERMHNANVDVKDNFGYAKRSSHQENMVPMGTLGALVLRTAWGELRVGTGFDDALRDQIWQNRESYTGQVVTFKYQGYGLKEKPRFPVFKAFREEE